MSEKFRFHKVHGLGNDFIIIDLLGGLKLPADLAGAAVKLCDRRFGIGADGLVLILPAVKVDAAMRIFNPDGSEAEMCGNAIRCVAEYLYNHGIVKRDEIKVETLAGIIVPRLILENGRVKAVRVDMGEPRLERREIPMVGDPGMVISEPLEIGKEVYEVTAVSMGNPHCIIFTDDVKNVPVEVLGPRIENHSSFPSRTNVEFIQVLNRREIRMRVWERGAGITMACGTGACAAAVAGALNGLTEKQVTVLLDGGPLYIEWSSDNHVYMTGPAREVFYGTVEV